MKKILPIFFMLLLGLNSFGLLFFYWGEIQFCHIEADNYIHSNHRGNSKALVIFSSDSKDFKVLNKREIFFNDKMFDVVKTEKQNGKTVYYAIGDEKEDVAISGIVQVTKNNSDDKSTTGKISSPDILKYINSKKDFNSQPIYFIQQISKIEFTNDSFFYQSPFGIVFSPPPEKFIS